MISTASAGSRICARCSTSGTAQLTVRVAECSAVARQAYDRVLASILTLNSISTAEVPVTMKDQLRTAGVDDPLQPLSRGLHLGCDLRRHTAPVAAELHIEWGVVADEHVDGTARDAPVDVVDGDLLLGPPAAPWQPVRLVRRGGAGPAGHDHPALAAAVDWGSGFPLVGRAMPSQGPRRLGPDGADMLQHRPAPARGGGQ
jgi:hypothetical protein